MSVPDEFFLEATEYECDICGSCKFNYDLNVKTTLGDVYLGSICHNCGDIWALYNKKIIEAYLESTTKEREAP